MVQIVSSAKSIFIFILLKIKIGITKKQIIIQLPPFSFANAATCSLIIVG
jgi:hypothetical protein